MTKMSKDKAEYDVNEVLHNHWLQKLAVTERRFLTRVIKTANLLESPEGRNWAGYKNLSTKHEKSCGKYVYVFQQF